MNRSLLRLPLFALIVALVAPPVEAQPRTGSKKPVVAAKRTRAVRPAARPTTRAKGKAKVTPRPRPDVAPRVMVNGSVRAPGDIRGRRATIAVTPSERAADALDALLRGPLRFGTTGLYVADATTGDELFAIHPDDPLNPASNVKLISTATALAQVGADFQYVTQVLGPSPDAAGAVPGAVYLRGSFDPTLSVAGIDDLARAVAARGVRAIHGDVVVGEQPTRDGIYRASVRVAITAGTPGQSPTVTAGPASDFFEVVNRATTSKRAKVKKAAGISVATAMVDRGGKRRLLITVSGQVGKGKTAERYLGTRERHLYTAHLLRAALARAGVVVDGDVRIATVAQFVADAGAQLPLVLGEHRSAPLADIVAQVNKRSINWLSDRVLTTTTALAHGTLPDMADGVDAMYGWLEHTGGIARGNAVIDTGSGLSYRTELSPRQLVTVVRQATGTAAVAVDPIAAAFQRSLSVGGVDGTLRGRFRSPLRGRVHAKTGTLTGVIALSGLLEGQGGRTLAFSLVTNGHSKRQKLAVRAAHEQVLTVLDRYLDELTPPPLAVAPAAAAPMMATAEPVTPEATTGEADDDAPTSELDRTGDGLADDAPLAP